MHRCYSCDEYKVSPSGNGGRSDAICPDCHAEIEREHAEHGRWCGLSFPQKLAENPRTAIVQVVNTIKYHARR